MPLFYHRNSGPILGLETLYRNGFPVGFIRRGDYCFHLQKNMGYAYIQRPDGGKVTNAFIKEGQYTLERMGKFYPAEAQIKSPFDPENRRIKGDYNVSPQLSFFFRYYSDCKSG